MWIDVTLLLVLCLLHDRTGRLLSILKGLDYLLCLLPV